VEFRRVRNADTLPALMKKAAPRKPRPAPRNWRLLAFLGVVFLVKLIVVLQLKDHVLLRTDTTIDTATYVTLAERVMAGDVALGTDVYYVSPLYIYFLALVVKIGGSWTAVRIVQVLLGTVAVGMIFSMTREWLGQRAAWIAAGLAAATGLFTFYEVIILQSGLEIFLTATSLWALTFALKRNETKWWIGTGVAFALATLSRPNTILAAGAIIAVLLLQRRLRGTAILAAGLAVGLAPVILRNVVVAHEFALMSSQGGLMFLIGNGDGATGLYRPLPGIRQTVEGQTEDTRRIAEAALGRPINNAQVSQYFSDQAFAWIRQHPGSWLRLLATKAYFLLNAQHFPLPLSYTFFAFDTGTLLQFLLIGPSVLIPLGLVGLAWTIWLFDRRERRDFLVWLVFVPVYLVSVALFIVSERYRLPLLVPLTMGSAGAIDLLISSFRARATKALVIAGAAVVLIGIAANWNLPFVDADGRGEERVHMAENVARFGDAAEAERWANLALERYPQKALLHYRVGVQLTNSGNFAPAISHLNKALAIDPSAGPVEFALAQTYDAAGQCPEAVPHYRRAIMLGINEKAAEAQRALAACVK
jgi:4-amino-4-deoxy-L-arabinose transferase-like glycosyltransferase